MLKNNVNSVTVVEKNQEIIEFFKKNILPQFNINKQFNIIQGDLFDYYKDEFLNKYSYVFVDVWENDQDGFKIYEKLMNMDVLYKNIDYWIEDSLIYTLKMMIARYFQALYAGNLTEVIISFDDEESRHLIRMVHKYFRNQNRTISKGTELVYIINSKTVIKEILRKQ